jgi:hypothetical protein
MNTIQKMTNPSIHKQRGELFSIISGSFVALKIKADGYALLDFLRAYGGFSNDKKTNI